MANNFEILMDFKNVRDFAVCMSKNDICCHKDKVRNCFSEIRPSEMQNECRRCWLDFLTSDEGLDLNYLDKVLVIESKSSPIRLTEKAIKRKLLKEK